MIRILLIFLLPLLLNASKILSYNIYDRTDRADVMITFDTPYEGVIKQSITKSTITIKLQDAKIEASKLKKLSSQYLYSINITPMSGYTQIIASVPNTVKLIASKTSDAYGLRLRFTPKTSTTTRTQEGLKPTKNFISTLPTKKNIEISNSYYGVIALLVIGIIILLFIKKKAITKNVKPKSNKWLFKESEEEQESVPAMQTDNVSIRFQKKLDNTNNVVMLDFADQSYLLLMGNSNILLDKFTDNKPATQEDFESILQNRHKELDNFLSLDDKAKEPLQAYKEKAASISYEV